jgi:hypothetical protein
MSALGMAYAANRPVSPYADAGTARHTPWWSATNEVARRVSSCYLLESTMQYWNCGGLAASAGAHNRAVGIIRRCATPIICKNRAATRLGKTRLVFQPGEHIGNRARMLPPRHEDTKKRIMFWRLGAFVPLPKTRISHENARPARRGDVDPQAPVLCSEALAGVEQIDYVGGIVAVCARFEQRA